MGEGRVVERLLNGGISFSLFIFTLCPYSLILNCEGLKYGAGRGQGAASVPSGAVASDPWMPCNNRC